MSKLRILACLSLLLVLPAMAVAQKPSKSVVPVLNSISPSSATAGGSAFTLTATGSKFTNGSVLRWNGSAVPTTVISSTQLQATLGSSQLASAGTATVFVFTSGRFGGTSNGLTFTINAPAPPPPPPPPPPAGDLTITTPSVPAGTAGSDYQANLAASGGTPAYTWSKASGSLPSGVTLQADGKLTGKPSQAGGPFTFTAQAKDSATQAQIATRELSMTVAAPPPPPGGGSYLFQSSGASPLSGWDSVWTKTDVTAASLVPTDPSFDPTPGLQRQGSAGTSLIKIHYAICGDSTKPTVCGEAHQDSNLNVTKYFNSSNGNPNGLEHFFVRGYFRLKSPAAGASTDIQRKLFYLKDPEGPDGTPNYNWAVVVNSFGTNGVVQLAYNHACTGFSTPQYFELGAVSFDEWHSLEVEVLANSPGQSDGRITIWFDGNQVAQDSAVNLRGTFTTGIARIEIGNQADRLNYLAVEEYRYWDDIVISTSRIGP